jgi:hypothetical protein
MGHNGITGRPQSESAFTRWFCDRLRRVNAITVAFVGGEMQQAGLPDRYVCHTCVRGWLEFKRGDRSTTPQQWKFMSDITKRGDTALIVRLDHTDWVRFEAVATHYSIKRGAVLAQLDYKLLKALGDPGAGLKILAAFCEAQSKMKESL